MFLSLTRGLDMAVSGSWQPPRPCEVYLAEWELCRSAGHVLQHYYVHGERPDCRQWLRDLTSCREWEKSHSAEAQVHLEAPPTLAQKLGPSQETLPGVNRASLKGFLCYRLAAWIHHTSVCS
ncbi:UPF0545 protein C22orf39 homolog isoform X1 [Mastomys coucha]|uniref:UPF0545 protein C22orf39 homolog isoform X1 n=1 Tax=Mastomys coucha TaxID=35658 RepID=UPI001262396F|nr:UPF0545 protein C22orf39 homolog isoform X1 [Mastomys coucha]